MSEIFNSTEEVGEDFRLLSRGIRGRWDIPQTIRTKSVNTIEVILSDPNLDPSLKLEAIKVVAALDKLNLLEEQIYTPKTVHITKTSTSALIGKLSGILDQSALNTLCSRLGLPLPSSPKTGNK